MAKKAASRTSRRTPAPPRIAIIVSRYNGSVTSSLEEAAIAEYRDRFGSGAVIDSFDAPGAFELTALSAVAARTGRYRGIVALGCVIRGETRHDRYICDAVAHGITQVTLSTGVPVAFGLLTTENAEQARARSGGKHGNKGQEAMAALLETIDTADRITRGEPLADRGTRESKALPDKARAAKGTASRAGRRRSGGAK